MESKYKVVVVGLKPGLEKNEVLAALSRLFKKPPELLDQKLGRLPWLVKSGLSHSDAEKYIHAIEKAGVACVIEEDAPKAAPAMKQPQQPKSPKAARPPEPPKPPARAPQKTETKIESRVAAAASIPHEPEAGKSRKGIFIAAAAVIVVLAVVLGWYFLGGKESPPEAPSPKAPAKTAEPAAPAKEPSSAQCIIAPGNPQTITLSGFAPFFHPSHKTGEIDPIMRISQNPWKDRGVDIKVSSVRLTPIQVELWEVGLGGGVFTLPSFPKDEIKVTGTTGPGPPDSFLASMKYSENVLSYIDFGKLSESGFEELVADQKAAEVRQATFTVYSMDINLTFSAPNGVADFTSEMGSRSGYIWVMLTGISTKDGNDTGGVDYQYGMKLQGIQKAGDKNLAVGLPEDNEYMQTNFTIDCR